MIGIKRTLLLSCSLLLIDMSFGSSHVDGQRRQLSKATSKSSASTSHEKSRPGKGGKGGKGGSSKTKSSKSEKSDSSKEGKKSSKKSSKKSAKKSRGQGGPTASPVMAPTPITPSPTSANSIPIRATPYSISYDTPINRRLNRRLPIQSDHLAELTELTRMHLEEFMFSELAGTSLTTLDDFLTTVITASEIIVVDYRSIGLFNPSSIFLPTVRELDGLITRAFTGDNLMAYLALVQALPSQNIFSSTSDIILIRNGADTKAAAGSATGGGTSSSTMAGIAAAAAGLFVLAAFLILLKRRKTEDEEYDETYDEKGNGDMAVVTGETFDMSVDSRSPSEMFMPWWWRDGNLHDSELEEEQDEGEVFERPSSTVAIQS